MILRNTGSSRRLCHILPGKEWVVHKLPSKLSAEVNVVQKESQHSPNVDKKPQHEVHVDLRDCQQEGKHTDFTPLCDPSVLQTGQAMAKVVLVIDCMAVAEVLVV